ncbi:hypothetical protein STCU_12377 [Strigomonas culicis]|uniref:Uncharacterized protein n=1 Tax=Strigomonas culicis TaxID=28005 RepID=S9TDL2_9TRYP|nr:hypothetical protein STCU_12377 [Strigomonas culicis]|eukprot:EPY15049.1 hypothetical protein STCU_12377 [Strigomonas culicis]
MEQTVEFIESSYVEQQMLTTNKQLLKQLSDLEALVGMVLLAQTKGVTLTELLPHVKHVTTADLDELKKHSRKRNVVRQTCDGSALSAQVWLCARRAGRGRDQHRPDAGPGALQLPPLLYPATTRGTPRASVGAGSARGGCRAHQFLRTRVAE